MLLQNEKTGKKVEVSVDNTRIIVYNYAKAKSKGE